MKQNNKVKQLKCAFSNAVHKILEPNFDKKVSERKRNNFSNEQKLEMFDKIMSLHNESSNRIAIHRFNKRSAKRTKVVKGSIKISKRENFSPFFII